MFALRSWVTLECRTRRKERQVPSGPFICSYCRASCERGTSACPNCGAPLDQPGSLRVSDADRDRAISQLTSHFEAGRLTPEEFDDRSGRALRARTQGELTALLADLPPVGAPLMDPAAGAPGVRRRPPGGISRLPVILVIIVVVLVVSGVQHHQSLIGLAPVLAGLFFLIRRRANAGRWPGEGDERGIGLDLRRDERRLRHDERHLRHNGLDLGRGDWDLRRDGRDLRRDDWALRRDDRDMRRDLRQLRRDDRDRRHSRR
jgi:hypothetical protein